MSHMLGSQPMPTATATVAGSQPSAQPVGHNYGISGPIASQSAPVSQQAQQKPGGDQQYDLIGRVRPLVVSLKESLAVCI